MFDDILQEEHPEKNGWWINELESLGVDTKNNADEEISRIIVIWSRVSSRRLSKNTNKLIMNESFKQAIYP